MKTLLLFLSLLGQPAFHEAVLTLTGASCIEELSEDEIIHYQNLASYPVDLNLAGRSRLLATGLLSPFQVASLLDYRSRTGEILSWTELALVDGFSPAIADALRLFAVLGVEEGAAPGQPEDRRFSGSVTLQRGISSGGTGWGMKTELAAGERAVLYASLRTGYESAVPGAPTLSAAWYGRRALGQLVVGHFNARFGQGLVQWSGFQLSGYSTLGSFRKNGTGFSPTGSYSPSLMGLATTWHFGFWDLSAAYSLTGHQIIANLNRTWRGVTAGFTATSEAVSLEARVSLPRWSLFGETALRCRGAAFSALAGAYYVPEYGRKAGLLLRWYGPSDKRYSGVAAGYETDVFSLTADAGKRTDTDATQYKMSARWHSEAEWRGFRLLPDLRMQARLRPGDTAPFRAQLRAELGMEREAWTLSGRYDILFCRDFAWNWHAELGRKTEDFAFYLRGGLFKVDNWDDRIYVYERDAPGSFTVPARYGRGWSASIHTVWHIRRHHSLWMRAETVQYPWNLTEKAGRSAVRLQYRYKW